MPMLHKSDRNEFLKMAQDVYNNLYRHWEKKDTELNLNDVFQRGIVSGSKFCKTYTQYMRDQLVPERTWEPEDLKDWDRLHREECIDDVAKIFEACIEVNPDPDLPRHEKYNFSEEKLIESTKKAMFNYEAPFDKSYSLDEAWKLNRP